MRFARPLLAAIALAVSPATAGECALPFDTLAADYALHDVPEVGHYSDVRPGTIGHRDIVAEDLYVEGAETVRVFGNALFADYVSVAGGCVIDIKRVAARVRGMEA